MANRRKVITDDEELQLMDELIDAVHTIRALRAHLQSGGDISETHVLALELLSLRCRKANQFLDNRKISDDSVRDTCEDIADQLADAFPAVFYGYCMRLGIDGRLGQCPEGIDREEAANEVWDRLKAAVLCGAGRANRSLPVHSEDSEVDELVTTAGLRYPRDEFTPEDRPSGEWARIFRIDPQTFRNRLRKDRRGPIWRVVEITPQRYIIHIDDLPKHLKTKPLRDDALRNGK